MMHPVRVAEAWIPMPDGVRLAANLFLPDGDVPAEGLPVLLEYLPYRKDDGLFERDWDLYSYMTARGYACAKVDIRGTGRSEGAPPDREYSEQEHADGDAVIAWLATQSWSTGAVGMWGISWGGFNSIQMAMRPSTPPALRAILAIDAADDLFHDDVHFIDGMLHVDEYDVMIDLDMARPGAPDFPLDEATLSARFDNPPWKLRWLREQRDGRFWQRGSLRPQYDRLRVPAYLIGGWYDGYRDSVPRMLEHCGHVPVKAVLGPHDHSFPHRGGPGPPFEHRAEAVRWFDRWLRDVRNGVEDEPRLAVYVRRWHPPGTDVTDIPGGWRFEEGWPVARVVDRTLFAHVDGSLGDISGDADAPRALRYRASSDGASGMWWGDLAPDQRALDACSLVFDSEPLERDLEILGFPSAFVRASADAPVANWFARLGDVAPDGRITLVAGGGLSGPQAAGSRNEPEALEPGREYDLTITMHVTSWTFPAGHRVRLSLSNAMWPMIWPTPSRMTTWVRVGGAQGARVVLPEVPSAVRPVPSFDQPAPPVPATGWQSGSEDVLPGGWHVERTGSVVTAEWSGSTWSEAPWGRSTYRESLTWRVDDRDPAHATVHGESETTVVTGDRTLRWFGVLDVASDAAAFDYRYRRELHENGAAIRRREWHERVPRDHQ
jgi:putative CocE/NonD family hydrolase